MTKILRAICWSLAAYLFIAAHFIYGPPQDWDWPALLPVLLSIFLFLLPFAQSISLGGFLSFDAKIDQVKEDLGSFRDEVRNMFNMQSTMISTVTQNVAQQTTVNLPSLNDAFKAERQLEERGTPALNELSNENLDGYVAQGLTPNLALAKLRMDLESEFRRILNKRTELGKRTDTKFLSLRSLWQEFFKRYEDKRYLLDGIEYVYSICNAAIHGQVVPEEHAEEAMSMGLRILFELKNIEDQDAKK